MSKVLVKCMINNWFRRTYSQSETPRILITGGLGQLGVALAKKLRYLYGMESVILSDVASATTEIRKSGQFVFADILDFNCLQRIVVDGNINWLIHLSALLSGVAEQRPSSAVRVNIVGLHNIMKLANQYNLRLFIPSTIAAFGPDSPLEDTPDSCIQRPTTLYGVGKVHMERLGEYYQHRFGLDFRCLRLPGIISSDSAPGGGTTDYAVHIFKAAVNNGSYECYLKEDTRLPMMHIDDCLNGIVKILEEPESSLKLRTYNINALSFTPKELADEIKKYIPEFKMSYQIDFRQDIADTWPKSLNDTNARNDWGWKHEIDFPTLVKRMIDDVKEEKEYENLSQLKI